MKAAYKILFFMGLIFVFVGIIVFVPFVLNIQVFGIMVAIPVFFVILGICFIVPFMKQKRADKKIMRLGKKRIAKISDYVEDTSATVNGEYLINTVVHYFDDRGKVCDAILETGFMRGSNKYPLGMSVDIYEYDGKVVWDKKSVRIEELPGGSQPEIVVSECMSCGSSFCSTKGFISKCPYCKKPMEG